jgi:hypothetical protein
VSRFTALGLSAAVCVVLSACGDDRGVELAHAACRAYAHTPPDRATADERASRAGEANESYASLRRDMGGAWTRSDAMVTAQNSGQEASADDLNAYFAADKRVRADCKDAGADLGPLRP